MSSQRFSNRWKNKYPKWSVKPSMWYPNFWAIMRNDVEVSVHDSEQSAKSRMVYLIRQEEK